MRPQVMVPSEMKEIFSVPTRSRDDSVFSSGAEDGWMASLESREEPGHM